MNIFKLAREKFKSAPQKEQTKICIASFLTVLVVVICVTFLFWNEICYFINPSWHLGHLAKNTMHKINQEQGYVSKKLFGVDVTSEAYHIDISATCYPDREKQSVSLTVAPAKDSVDIGFTTAKNDVPVLQTVAQWNDTEIAFSSPQTDDNRYYIPTENPAQNFYNTPFAKSLPFKVPEHLNSLAYTKVLRTDQSTRDTANHTFKQFLDSLEYMKREKTSMELNGKNSSVHLIHTKCTPESLSEFVSSLYLLYTDGILKDTALSHTLSEICDALKENANGKAFNLDLIERNSYLIGFKTHTYTVYFHSGLFLNGFTVESADQAYTIKGDIQFKGGVMNFELLRCTTWEEPEKIAGVYLYRRAKKLLFDLPQGTFSLNVQCANSEQNFAIFENMVPFNGEYADFAISVKASNPDIPTGTTNVLLTEKPLDYWTQKMYPAVTKLLKDTMVFPYLSQQ